MQSKPLNTKMSQRVLYRAILHGPMTWKVSQPGGQVCEEAPYLVAFEPMGSIVVLAHGTMVLPQLFVQGDKGEERQVLSVFIFAKATVAKEFVSALYKAIDKKFKLLDIFKSPPLLEIIKRSLSSFHLPLEIVLRKIDYSLVRRNTLRRDTGSKFGGPLSEHNTTGIIDSYNLRVGLGEGIPSIKDLTELNQHVLKCLDRKGANVNRLSLSFYKLGIMGDAVIPHRLGCMTPGPLMQTSVYNMPNRTKSLFGGLPGGCSISRGNVARSVVSYVSKFGECRLKSSIEGQNGMDKMVEHSIDLDALRNMSTNDAEQNFVALDSIRATIQSTDRPMDVSKTNGSLEGFSKMGGSANLSKMSESPEDVLVGKVSSEGATSAMGKGSPHASYTDTHSSVQNVKTQEHVENYEGLVQDLKRISEENLRMKQANQKYKSRNTKLNEQVATLKREHERAIQNLKNEQDHIVEHLKDEHKRQVATLHNEHERQVATLKSEHDHTIKNLMSEHEHELENVRNDCEDEMDDMRRDCLRELDYMASQHETHISTTRHELNETKMLLKEAHLTIQSMEEEMAKSFAQEETLANSLNEHAKLMKKLKHVEEKYLQASSLLKEAQDPEAFVEMQKQVTKVQKSYEDAQERYTDMQERYESVQERYKDMQERHSDLQAQVAEMQETIAQLNEENGTLRARLQESIEAMESKEEKLRAKLNKSREKIEILSTDNVKAAELEQENRILQTRVDSLLDKLEAVEDAKKMLATELESKERVKRELECKVDNMKISIEKLTRGIEEHERSGSRLDSKLELLEANNGALLKKLEDVKLELSNANAAKRQLQKNFDALEKTSSGLKKNVESLQRSNLSLNKKNDALKGSLSEMERAYESLKSSHGPSIELEQLKVSNNALSLELEQLRTSHDALEMERKKLQNTHVELQEELARLKRDSVKLQETNSGLEKAEADLSAKLVSTRAKLEDLREQVAKLETTNAELKRDAESMEASGAQLRRKIQSMETSEAHLRKKIQTLETSSAEVKNKLDLERTKTGDLKEKLEVAESHKIKWKKETERVKMEIVQVENELSRVNSEYKRNKTELGQMDRERGRLEKELGKCTGDLLATKKRNVALCARLFRSMVDQTRQHRELVILRARCTFTTQKAASGKNFSKLLISNVLRTKAKLAKRTCQFARIVDALSIERPATLSSIMDGIEKLKVASASCQGCDAHNGKYERKTGHHEIERLKKSFMRACSERDEKIKDLESKIKTFNKATKNEKILISENEKLKNQLRIERDNLYSLEDDVKVQIETEMIRSSNEKNALYAKQYELIMQNSSLQKENERLKHTISLMSTHVDETFMSTRSSIDERMNDVHDGHYDHSSQHIYPFNSEHYGKMGRVQSIFNLDEGGVACTIDKHNSMDKSNVARYDHVDGYGRIEGYGGSTDERREEEDDEYFAVQGPVYRGEKRDYVYSNYINRTPYITVPPYYN